MLVIMGEIQVENKLHSRCRPYWATPGWMKTARAPLSGARGLTGVEIGQVIDNKWLPAGHFSQDPVVLGWGKPGFWGRCHVRARSGHIHAGCRRRIAGVEPRAGAASWRTGHASPIRIRVWRAQYNTPQRFTDMVSSRGAVEAPGTR
jgi:hypothetical protein